MVKAVEQLARRVFAMARPKKLGGVELSGAQMVHLMQASVCCVVWGLGVWCRLLAVR
jgi:hypothetical protein